MRISTQMMQRYAVSSILDRQTDLNRTQQQLASGKKILTPAEDPSGTTQLLALQQQLDQSTQYQSNIDRLNSRLEVEETVLSSVGDALQRVRELAVQGHFRQNIQSCLGLFAYGHGPVFFLKFLQLFLRLIKVLVGHFHPLVNILPEALSRGVGIYAVIFI